MPSLLREPVVVAVSSSASSPSSTASPVSSSLSYRTTRSVPLCLLHQDKTERAQERELVHGKKQHVDHSGPDAAAGGSTTDSASSPTMAPPSTPKGMVTATPVSSVSKRKKKTKAVSKPTTATTPASSTSFAAGEGGGDVDGGADADGDDDGGRRAVGSNAKKKKKDPAAGMRTLNSFFNSVASTPSSASRKKDFTGGVVGRKCTSPTPPGGKCKKNTVTLQSATTKTTEKDSGTTPSDAGRVDCARTTDYAIVANGNGEPSSSSSSSSSSQTTDTTLDKKKTTKSPSKEEIRAIALGTLGIGVCVEKDGTSDALALTSAVSTTSSKTTNTTTAIHDTLVIFPNGIASQRYVTTPLEEEARRKGTNENKDEERLSCVKEGKGQGTTDKNVAMYADTQEKAERGESETKEEEAEDSSKTTVPARETKGMNGGLGAGCGSTIGNGGDGALSYPLTAVSQSPDLVETNDEGDDECVKKATILTDASTATTSAKKRRAKLTLVSALVGGGGKREGRNVAPLHTNAGVVNGCNADDSVEKRNDGTTFRANTDVDCRGAGRDNHNGGKRGGGGSGNVRPSKVNIRLNFSPIDEDGGGGGYIGEVEEEECEQEESIGGDDYNDDNDVKQKEKDGQKSRKAAKKVTEGIARSGSGGRGGGKDKKKKGKDPNAPKRAASAYIFYVKERRHVLQKECPNKTFGEVSKAMSAEFKSLTAKERKRYDDLAVLDRDRYRSEMSAYGDASGATCGKMSRGVRSDKITTTTTTTTPPRGIDMNAATAPSSSTSMSFPEKNSASASYSPQIHARAPPDQLTDEVRSTLEGHEALRNKYILRAEELVSKAEMLEEESFQAGVRMVDAETEVASASLTFCAEGSAVVAGGEVGLDGTEFPDSLLSELAVLVQGSAFPLSALAEAVLPKLSQPSLRSETVADKIKIIAERKQYLSRHPWSSGDDDGNGTATVNPLEDDRPAYLWRWELTTLDLLPPDLAQEARRAKAARTKLQRHHRSALGLIAALDRADAALLDPKSTDERRKGALAKVGAEEEKVLKFEREEERARLAHEARAQREALREKARAEREAERRHAEEGRRKEREEAKRRREEVAQAKEEAKRKREEAAERRRIGEEEERAAAAERQKARMLSYFGGKKAMPRQVLSGQEAAAAAVGSACAQKLSSSFDGDAFWGTLGSRDGAEDLAREFPPFAALSASARASRRRRTRKVSVTVYVTVVPENPFDRQPFDEERVVTVPNKYKFLSFHEDYRPPYHGTWSKPRSSIISGRRPFAKDTSYLDYDVDSEAEWEENDDEPGEDCDVDDGDDDDDEDKLIDDEEGDTRVYNYQDGWMAQDDDLGLEDDEDDEEAKALRRRKLQGASDGQGKDGVGSSGGRAQCYNTVCVIAPLMGGLPQMGGPCSYSLSHNSCPELVQELVEGVNLKEAESILASHVSQTLMPDMVDLRFDAFPPEEKAEPRKEGAAAESKSSKPSQQMLSTDMSVEEKAIFAKFVHNNTLGSREKVVEGFRSSHPKVAVSRAEMLRKLDTISEKRRLKGGCVWEVKEEILKKCELTESDLRPAPVEPPTSIKRKAGGGVGGDKLSKKKAKKSKKKSVDDKPPTEESTPPDHPLDDSSCIDLFKPSEGKKAKKGKKRGAAGEVPKASAALFAAFLSKKKAKAGSADLGHK